MTNDGYTSLTGLNTYIGLIDKYNKYLKSKNDKNLQDMNSNLFELHTILNNPELESLLPNDLVVKFKLALNQIPELLKERAKIDADTTLSDEKKASKLYSIDKKLEKAEEEFGDLIQKQTPSFISTMRNELAYTNPNLDGATNVDLTSDVMDEIKNISVDILSDEIKDIIINEINRLNTEELTIKDEKEEDLENENNISSYNLEKAVDTVNGVDKNNENYSNQYSKAMKVKAITHRLQQINKELIEVKKSKHDYGTYEREDAIKLQALITEQAKLTKELMNVKRNALEVMRDLNLNITNKRANFTEKVLNFRIVKADNRVSKFIRKELNKGLASLKEKQGKIVSKSKIDVLAKMDKLASKTEKTSKKVAYKSIKAKYFVEGIEGSFGKIIVMAAMPKRILIREKMLERLENQEELYTERTL